MEKGSIFFCYGQVNGAFQPDRKTKTMPLVADNRDMSTSFANGGSEEDVS